MNPELWDTLVNVIEVFILPFCVWIIKNQSEMKKDIAEIRTVLIGVDGRNGLRSRVIRLERRGERFGVALAEYGIHVAKEGEDDI